MGWTSNNDSFADFVGVANGHGFQIEKSSQQEDIHQHIDGFLTISGYRRSFDLKSRKKISRNDNGHQDEFVWVEFKNVRGNRGWVHGDADLIIFEREKDYVFVPRPKLAQLAEFLVDKNILVCSSKDALYALYTRKGRSDQISMIKMEDVLEIAEAKWNKDYGH